MNTNTHYQTTSINFKPNNKFGVYYHKKLDPEDANGWKKGTKVLIRATSSGKDYIILFLKDGVKVTNKLPNFPQSVFSNRSFEECTGH